MSTARMMFIIDENSFWHVFKKIEFKTGQNWFKNMKLYNSKSLFKIRLNSTALFHKTLAI